MTFASGSKVRAVDLNQVTVQVCTSGTHPASPAAGEPIFETDTGLSANYNATSSTFSYELGQIAPTQVLVGTTASVTFSNIPAVTRLLWLWRGRSSAAGLVDVEMQFDGNTGTNYLWSKGGSNNGASAAAHSAAAVAFMKIGIADGTTASYFSSGRLDIDGWSQSTGFATASGTGTLFSTTTSDAAEVYAGQFNVVGPHSSIKVLLSANSFAAGSQFSLYGGM
jgi:hypothetical protein